MPFWHWVVPSAQGATLLWPHATPVPEAASSTMPLQLLSMPSHVSACGSMAPTHRRTPPLHWYDPT
ncbi:hypothetical protein L6R50_28235, partial [Myxococcota bacterium]|nr:hypothetical protein [Myxococcota bacterium]